MKQLDKGLILHRISYSESSYILKIFTESQGLKSFLFLGGKKKKGQQVILFSPIEFSFYQRNDSQLGKLTELKAISNESQLHFNPIKASILYFQAEILLKCIHENDKDEHLFHFLEHEIAWLSESNLLSNYPLFWLLELSKYLGFYPLLDGKSASYFDLEEGIISDFVPNNHVYESSESVKQLAELIPLSKTFFLATKLSKTERKNLLNLLLKYYQFHIANFKEIKSIEILEEVMSEG